jgi:hypothetical protein
MSPYIDTVTRKDLDRLGEYPQTPGELTYLITKVMIDNPNGYNIVQREINEHVAHYLGDRKKFSLFAEVLGSLDAAQREWKRRRVDKLVTALVAVSDYASFFYNSVIAPYEDTKIQENGDVYA